MNKKSLKRFMQLFIVMAIVLLGLRPVNAKADEGGTVEIEGLTASKYVRVEDDGTYTIELEAFSTGEVKTETVVVPADIILVLDVSGSMEEDMSAPTYNYTARASESYSYNGYGNSEYYYKDDNGNYHKVVRYRYDGIMRDRYYLRYSSTDNNYNWVYLTGTTTTTTRPTSGYTNANATIWTGVLYERTENPSVSKLDALKDAVDTFIDEVALKNKEAEDALKEASEDGTVDAEELAKKQSRIAIVKFSGNRAQTNYDNYVEGNTAYYDNYYRMWIEYTQVVADLGIVVQGDSETDPTTATSWKNIVDSLQARGMTRADYGMGYANAILNNHPVPEGEERSQVVVMFTDGLPTSVQNFEADVANAAISSSKTMKDRDVTVYSIAVHPDADPSQDPGTENFNQYLHGVSSNYPGATAYNNLGTRGQGNYYYAAESADQLEAIFKEIGHSSGSTTSELSSETVMKDIVSGSFTLPEHADGVHVEDITITVVRWNTNTRKWGTGTGYEFTPDGWETYTKTTYGDDKAEKPTANISGDGKTIDITGFDYAKHYKATSAEQDADNTFDQSEVNKDTAKIKITIPILAKPSAVTGGSVATNGEESGIYKDGSTTEALVKFPVPEVVFTPVTYVVDYVTSDTTADTKASSVKLEYNNVLGDVQMLDDPSDDVLKGISAEDFKYTIYKGRFGTISFGDDEEDVQRRYVRYVPTTMDWNDYDRIFVKGVSKDDQELNVWAMLAVVPANSVYYEDTFITQTKTVTYNGEPVNIEYTGIAYDEGKWSTIGIEGDNTTQHADKDEENNPIPMGWIDVLADDPGYSNGIAHVSDTAKATATFTVSGTGIDIYSRTNGTTGTVSVTVRNAENGKLVAAKSIDTKAASGDYYNVPVYSFKATKYGTYAVTVKVTTGGQKEGRLTFYLDGIRVYNPIQPHEDDGVVQQVYTEENLGAQFDTVRDLLLDGDGVEAEAVYIDQHTVDPEVESTEAIRAAAEAMAQAQQALDEYEAAESALERAKVEQTAAVKNVTTAQTNLNKAQEALDNAGEGDDIEALTKARDDAQTALDEAQTAKDEADAAVTTAQNKFDQVKEAKSKEERQSEYETAKQNYITATTGYSEIPKTTDDISVYDKEGPKSEVYLDNGQAVVISTKAGKTYYIALKALDNATTVNLNGTTKEIAHSADLYYKVEPINGKITIINTGNGTLSITKLRTTGVDNTESGAKSAPTEELLQAFRSIKAMSVVPEYTGEVLTEEEAAEETVITEIVEEAEEETEIALDESDIIIENTEAEPEAEPEPAAETVTQNSSNSTMSNLLSSFFGFFRRR